MVNAAFEYGRNIGLAFQLVDDLLDFVGSSQQLGKPASGADLKLGLATAPVLFASVKFPELEPLIQRRFSNQGDVEAAFKVSSIFAMGHISKGCKQQIHSPKGILYPVYFLGV